MTECLTKLVGLRSLCTSTAPPPLYFLDDIEGMDAARLADLATAQQGTGQKLFTQLLDSAARMMLGDIESLLPQGYSIQSNQLENVCSSCNWSGFYAPASPLGSGTVVKNTSGSRYSTLRIDSFRAKVNTNGPVTFKITDGVNERTITETMIAGQEVTFTGVNYATRQPQARIYVDSASVQLAQILCPNNSTCGCGSSAATAPTDLQVRGYNAGGESDTQYGMLVCASVGCSYDEILCSLINTSQRLFGLALLYLVASKAFATNVQSQRNNRTASFDKEDKKDLSEVYHDYYRERLTGKASKNILGIQQALSKNLATLKDGCITCTNPVGIAWATG